MGKGVAIFMVYRKSTKHKTITADNGADFDARLNAFTESLDARRIDYEVQTNPLAGFIAFIKYKEDRAIPENAKDEHELAGDRFYCGSCPMLSQSTDGRFKNLRCKRNGKLRNICTSTCCNAFYEWMESGKWSEYQDGEDI